MDAKVKYIIAVLIYGTIGMILRRIVFPSEIVVLARGIIGSLFIYVYCRISKRPIDIKAIRQNIKPLVLSGICLGLNWVFLFLSYKTTTVAVGSLCNYLAPVMLIVLMVISGKTKLTPLKTGCILAAVIGVFLISGIISLDLASVNLLGMIFGLLAACGFVGLIIFNKQIVSISCYDKAIVQLFVSACTVLPYAIINNLNNVIAFNGESLMLTLLLGLVHTGVAYLFYFDSMPNLDVQSIAILGYLEPVVSVLSSVFILNEPMDFYGWIGTILILAGAMISEMPRKEKA